MGDTDEYLGEVVGVLFGLEAFVIFGIWNVLLSLLPPRSFLTSSSRSLVLLSLCLSLEKEEDDDDDGLFDEENFDLSLLLEC